MIGVQADWDGYFQLEVPFSEKAIELTISFVGYETVHLTIVPNKNQDQLVIEIKEPEHNSEYFIDGFVITMPLSKQEQRSIKRLAKQEAKRQTKQEKRREQ